VRWITGILASLTLGFAACAPPRATSSTALPATDIPAATVVPSPATTAAPLTQPSTSPAAGPEVKIVEPPFRPAQQWTYAPTEVSVKVGVTVVWTNTGAVAHTVTADDGKTFDSGSIDPKAVYALAPPAVGTFAYHCTFHPWMTATLVVTP
jgi:plastocyanin